MDKEVIIEADCHIGSGDDFRTNSKEPKLLNTGINIIGKRTKVPSGVKMGHNCIIYNNVVEEDFSDSAIQSGETIKTRRRGPARTA